MDEKALLDAIRGIVREEVVDAEKRIAKNTAILMDAEFGPRFNLLEEGQQAILDQIPTPDVLEAMQDELDLHHAMLKKHTQEIQALKKAN